jgi:hypothetical protein
MVKWGESLSTLCAVKMKNAVRAILVFLDKGSEPVISFTNSPAWRVQDQTR